MRPQLQGKDVVVYGLGKSGISAVKLLGRQGARVRVVDSKPKSELEQALRAAGLEVAEVSAPSPEVLSRAELVVVSPGVPLANPELQESRAQGAPLWGEVELAYRFLAPGRFVGISGTNGKSTTTALTGELLRAAGKRPFVGGNLGLPLCEAALSPEAYDGYVVELSSFQLEGISELRLNAAAFLNVQPDHIDRYADLDAYAAAKSRMFQNQRPGDVAVVNADDPVCRREARKAKVPVRGFAMEGGPLPSAERGFFSELALGDRTGFRLRGVRYELRNKALRGVHNVQNAMAAALLALHEGASAEAIQRGLDSYPGLAHRMEFVAAVDGVEWINDSKATNVDSSLVALAAFDRGVWLIAGGKGKGAPYTPLVEASRGRVRGVLTIGQDAARIEEAYRGVVPVHPCETLERAVSRARELAKSGDTVLLSPACASYDQFKNFEDRGDQFKRMVRAS